MVRLENMKKNIPNVIQYNSDYHGCGFWRLLWPQLVLNMRELAGVSHTQVYIRDFVHYAKADVIHMQRQGRANQVSFFKKLHHIRERMQFRMIYEADDILFGHEIPEYNFAKKDIEETNDPSAIRETIELCDEMTVSTPYLRDYYLKHTNQKKISVIPNYPPLFWLSQYYSEERLLSNYRQFKNRPRILYSGSPSHFNQEGSIDDFTHVVDAIIATKDEFKWIFVGGLPKALEPFILTGEMEHHPWQTIEMLPRFLTMLRPCMMFAPLRENTFNMAKSDIKFLEAGGVGLPVVCQDMSTYAIAPHRFKSGEDMIEKIRKILQTEDTFLEASREGRKIVDHRWLERSENIGRYADLYSFPYGDPNRKFL